MGVGCVCVYEFWFSAGEAVEAESYDPASMNLSGLECDAVESFEHHVMLRTRPLCVASCFTRLKVAIPYPLVLVVVFSLSFFYFLFTVCWSALAGQISLTLWSLKSFKSFFFRKCVVDCGLGHALALVERKWTRCSLFVYFFNILAPPKVKIFVESLLAGEAWLRGGTDMCEMSLCGPAAART